MSSTLPCSTASGANFGWRFDSHVVAYCRPQHGQLVDARTDEPLRTRARLTQALAAGGAYIAFMFVLGIPEFQR